MTENYHTLALDNVPIFGLHNRTAAYRFVTLVDVSLFYSLVYLRPVIVMPQVDISSNKMSSRFKWSNCTFRWCTRIRRGWCVQLKGLPSNFLKGLWPSLMLKVGHLEPHLGQGKMTIMTFVSTMSWDLLKIALLAGIIGRYVNLFNGQTIVLR